MTRKGSVNNFYDNFYNYIFSSEQVYFSEIHDVQKCEMEEQTTAYSTQTALCMHRGWVGITSASTALPWYLQFSSLHLYTWMGRLWLGQHIYYPFCISHRELTPQAILFLPIWLSWNHCNWNLDFFKVTISPVDFQALLHHTALEQPRNPFVLPLPLLFPPKPNMAHFRQTSMQNKLKNIHFKSWLDFLHWKFVPMCK